VYVDIDQYLSVLGPVAKPRGEVRYLAGHRILELALISDGSKRRISMRDAGKAFSLKGCARSERRRAR
jgi:hypothetical protein